MLDTTLENGLRVLVQPRSAAPLVAIYVWLDAGTADEPAGLEGAAHLLEHMLFKGTGTRGVGESAGEIEGLGGDLNAYTTYDQTVLHATVEQSGFERTVHVLADMLRDPAFDPAEFLREKQVVLEEIRAYDDEPESVVEDLGATLAFPQHAYGRPILGTLSTVSGIDRDALVRFFRSNYGPNRAIVAVAGAVDPVEGRRVVEAAFGDWAPVAPRSELGIAPAPDGPSSALVDRTFESRAVEIAWRAPAHGHPDLPALDVLATVLGVGSASLLQVRVQLEDGVATDPWCALTIRRAGGLVSAGASPREGRSRKAIEAILDVVEEVRDGRITRQAVHRARESILADYLFAAETVDGAAHDLAWYAARTGDPRGGEAHRRAVAMVTVEDVVRVARTWLVPATRTLVALDNALPSEALDTLARPRPRPPVRRRSHEPVKHVVDNGATVLVLPDDSEVVGIRVVCAGGRTLEHPRTAGLHAAWAQMVGTGAGDLDATSFGEAIDDLAGTFDGTAGRNGIGLRATFPAEVVADALELTADVILEPHFDDEEWDRVRDELQDERITIQDRPGAVASQLLWNALWAGHPWRLPRWGTQASLENIRPGTLHNWHRTHMRADNVVLAVAGGIDPEEILEMVTPWLEELPTAAAPKPPAEAPPPRPVERRTVAGREQAYVLMGWRGLPTSDPDRIPLGVLTAWLNGQAGRLFLELRERRGLAYSVWAQAQEGLGGGTVSVGLATDPQRLDEARAALSSVVASVVERPPDAEEVARAVRMAVGHTAMGLQRAIDRATDAALGERFGVPWGFEAQRRLLERVTAVDVQRVAERILAEPATRAIVEPRR